MTAEAKGRRYLAEGRLLVTAVTGDVVEATCRGDGAVYRLGWHGTWECSCPARTERCAHLTALRLVVIRPGLEEPPPPHPRSEPITGGSHRTLDHTPAVGHHPAEPTSKGPA